MEARDADLLNTPPSGRTLTPKNQRHRWQDKCDCRATEVIGVGEKLLPAVKHVFNQIFCFQS